MRDDSLDKLALFQGISEEEREALLRCVGAAARGYQKGDQIYRAGDCVDDMGIVLSGSVNIENHDVWGNRTILDHIGPGQAFAETYACIPGEPMMVDAVAAEDAGILFLNVKRLLTTCPAACQSHGSLIRNLLMVTARKNLTLTRKIFHTASKSIRGRLLSYLSYQAVRQGSARFEIPFNRQQLADYLGVDRSAMSNELSKMRREGLLTFEKNQFCLNESCLADETI